MPKIVLDDVPEMQGSSYPPPYDAAVRERRFRRIGAAAGIGDFGANHVRLPPGAWSSQRHWHEGEDELVVMIAGEAVLVDDTGRTAVRPGDVLAFPKGDGNAHHLVNESDAECVFVAIGKAGASAVHYPDCDMELPVPGQGFRRRDGTAY